MGTLRHPLRAQGVQLQCKHEQWSQKRLKINEKKSQSFSTFNGFLIFICCKFFHIAHRKVISKLNFILLHSNVKSLHFGHIYITTKLKLIFMAKKSAESSLFSRIENQLKYSMLFTKNQLVFKFKNSAEFSLFSWLLSEPNLASPFFLLICKEMVCLCCSVEVVTPLPQRWHVLHYEVTCIHILTYMDMLTETKAQPFS